jgi:hypothetical protein
MFRALDWKSPVPAGGCARLSTIVPSCGGLFLQPLQERISGHTKHPAETHHRKPFRVGQPIHQLLRQPRHLLDCFIVKTRGSSVFSFTGTFGIAPPHLAQGDSCMGHAGDAPVLPYRCTSRIVLWPYLHFYSSSTIYFFGENLGLDHRVGHFQAAGLPHGSPRWTAGRWWYLDRVQNRGTHRAGLLPAASLRCGRPISTREDKVLHRCPPRTLAGGASPRSGCFRRARSPLRPSTGELERCHPSASVVAWACAGVAPPDAVQLTPHRVHRVESGGARPGHEAAPPGAPSASQPRARDTPRA